MRQSNSLHSSVAPVANECRQFAEIVGASRLQQNKRSRKLADDRPQFGEYGFDRKRVGHQPFIDPINDGDGVPARLP